MISPHCSLIMETPSTTSVYNTIERNVHSEHIHSNVGDSTDGLNENELLEEPGRDPEDEDTLSDDSLRLRLSDDEADASQARAMGIPTAPNVSTEQTTSRDAAMGLTKSDEKVTNEECLRSKHRSQILTETHVGGKKNINGLWRGGNRREHSSNNIIHSPKRSLRGHSLHVRYNHSHSNIHKIPSYFNNHDNFGRPPGYRRHKNNWRHAKGKYLHGNTRNVQRNIVKEQALKPKSELSSKLNAETEILVSNKSDSVEQAPSSVVDNIRDATSPGAVTCWSANENSVKTLVTTVDKNNDSLPSVNDELSKECAHLNLDKELTLDSKSSKNSNPNNSNWKNPESMSNYDYDSQFASDNWFDESPDTHDKYVPCSETSSPLLSQDSSDFQGVGTMSPVQDTESAIPAEKKNETATEDTSLPQSSNLSSPNLAKVETETEPGGESNDAKVNSNTEIDVPCDIPTKVDTDGLACKSPEKSNAAVDPSSLQKGDDSEVTSSESCDVLTHSKEMEILGHQSNTVDETTEVEEDRPHETCTKQDPSNEESAENKERTETQKTDFLSPEGEAVAVQPMEIDTKDKDIRNDTENQDKQPVLADIQRKPSLDVKPIEVAECSPQEPETLKNTEVNVKKKTLLCNEISDNRIDNCEINLNEKSLSKHDSDVVKQLPSAIKRSLPDAETVNDKLHHKKIKIIPDPENRTCSKLFGSLMATGSASEEKKFMPVEKRQGAPKALHYVRKFFQRDMKGKLTKLKREDLEELIIQKLVETITMRSEIGRLREQARLSERNQEATRVRCQQLSKQIKDFEMVLSRNAVDRRSNNDKPVPPIKINRSVGLQVNFVTEQGIQSLRALSTNNTAKTNVPSPVIANGGNSKTVAEKINHTTAVRRGLKVRSPRRADAPKTLPAPVQPQTSTATPAALVMSKSADMMHNLSIPNNKKEHPLPNVNHIQPATAKVQNVVLNGKIPHHVNRQTGVPNNQKTASNDLIDLTEEEDKNRSTGSSTSSILPMVGTVTSSIGTKVVHSRYQRVVQATLPGNVAITTQSANIRVVQSAGQPTPTALVNNINTTRLAYVMQGTPGTGRQLLIAPNPNQIRPALSTTRSQYSSVTYKSAAVSTLANGNVRVITTAAPTIPNSQPPPAPLPDTPHYPNKTGWKLPPPPPSLKISKVTQGIVLSWNMVHSESYADIASYQLYAYQEIPGTPPNSNLWKKVGDVRALPLPMACTLKEFTPGNNYHFAVRAVDTHSRLGQYSVPKNISL